MTNLKEVTIEVENETVSDSNPFPVVAKDEVPNLLAQILEELRKINIHLETITGEEL